MAIIDTFLLFNELDLLEIRLSILDPVVDKFVIVESTKTFKGDPKPLNFDINRYAKWKDKIHYHVVDEISEEEWNEAKRSPNVGAGEHWWLREYAQKEQILKALASMSLKDDDIIFVSDLDEIWNPEAIFSIGYNFQYECDKVYRPIQTAYHYYLNNRSDQDINGWVGTRFGTYKTLKKYGVNHFRTEREVKSIPIENGGWHFSFIGGTEVIKYKIESYGHQEHNTESIKNNIGSAMTMNVDFLNRGFRLWRDETQLPKYLIENKAKWKHLFL